MLVGMAAIFSAVGDKKHCYTTGAPRVSTSGGWPEGWTIGQEHARLSVGNDHGVDITAAGEGVIVE